MSDLNQWDDFSPLLFLFHFPSLLLLLLLLLLSFLRLKGLLTLFNTVRFKLKERERKRD